MTASFSEVRDALGYISASQCRDEWWKIAAAIKNEFGDSGFVLWDEWSQGGDGYNEKDVRATWTSTKSDGHGKSITVATLFKLATDNGYKPHKPVKKTVAKAVIKRETSNKAQAYWDRAHDCDSHQYSDKKGLDTAGLKKYKGRLLIPAYDAAGAMSSLQEISKDGKKIFLQGCTISGCWYTIPGDNVLIVAEGWATAKSINMATGHTAIVAFGSSGFMKVPPLLREKYPEARIILAPDNDVGKDAVKKATRAARESGCEFIVPEVEDGTDFNDLHQCAGLDEVRRQFAKNVKKPRLHDLVLVELKDVTPRAVAWLWPGKFALGKLVLLGGVPSTGKTTISHSIVSIVSNGGQWPFSNDRAPRGRAIILTCEDDLDDTVVPRLIAAGADLDKVTVIQSVAGQDRQKPFVLARDLHQLDGLLKERPDTLLVVFDPLSAYLGAADSHRDSDVRMVLGPLCQLAADHQITVLGIGHLNKNEAQSAMARFMGSGGIIAAARSAYLTASIDDQLMMLPVKNNLAPHEDASGLTYQIKTALVADGITTSVIEWTGETEMWANEALAKESGKNRAPKLLAAQDFLQEQLADGPKRQTEIEEEAISQGHSAITIRRAKNELGYKSHKDGLSGGWKWYTPEQWDNYQKVLNKGKNGPNLEADDHLRFVAKNEKKSEVPQAQKYDHLRGKRGVKTGLKPTGSKGFTEGDHVPEKNEGDDHVKNSKKSCDEPKVIKSSLLGNSLKTGTDLDDWGVV